MCLSSAAFALLKPLKGFAPPVVEKMNGRFHVVGAQPHQRQHRARQWHNVAGLAFIRVPGIVSTSPLVFAVQSTSLPATAPRRFNRA
jgi:hypothetical protein